MPRTPRTPWSRRQAAIATLLLVFALAAVAGAYLDWVLWEPYSGITLTIGAGLVVLLAIVFAIPARSRALAAVAGAIGIGLLAGQNLGPSRPPLRHSEGSLTLTLSAPTTSSGSIVATCSRDDAARELSVSGDPNLRLDIVPDDPAIPADVDQREFVGVSLFVGDRWRGVIRRDMTSLEILVGRVEADAIESRMMAGPSSELDVEFTAQGGIARFARLVPDTRFSSESSPFIDLAGMIEWTCGDG